MKTIKLTILSALVALSMSAVQANATGAVAELATNAVKVASGLEGAAARIVEKSMQSSLEANMNTEIRLQAGIAKATENLNDLLKQSGNVVGIDGTTIDKLKEVNAEYIRAVAEARSNDAEKLKALAQIGEGELIQFAANAVGGDTRITGKAIDEVLNILKEKSDAKASLKETGAACRADAA